MGGISVDGKDGNFIQSVGEMFGRFTSETLPLIGEWEHKLREHPEESDAIEHEVQRAFSRGAGLVMAGLTSVFMQTQEFAERAEQTRTDYSVPLARGRNRTMAVQLLGGVVMWVTSLYCQARRGMSEDDNGRPGLHIEQTQFGFGKKVSAGLETDVARQSALGPSFELARSELSRRGVDMNVKVVRRVAEQCGEKLLKLRTHDLEQFRAGTLECTDELAGKKVSVQIDGGRTKLRGALSEPIAKPATLNEDGQVIDDAPGRSKPTAGRSFHADWKEPKLITIFIHNDKGRMEKKSQATIDGTFTGPDATAELVAMHLHRLGAAKAESVTFVADGAPWIWDRIDAIVADAKLPKTVAVHRVLDNCHAAHHVSLALAALGLTSAERMPMYRELRTRLRNGQWESVVAELEQYEELYPENAELRTPLNYLRKHGAAGHLDYSRFRELGLPLGSGAIESSIRRVINLRLKGNGIFWRIEQAEAMLQLRALVVTDRWDSQVRRMRSLLSRTCILDWHWTPRPMSREVETEAIPAQNAVKLAV